MKNDKEKEMSKESREMLKLLINGGIVKDSTIKNKDVQEMKQKRQQFAFHNTELLLRNYRKIVWLVEYFPDFIAAELEESFKDVDELINRLDVNMAYGNKKLENRMDSLQKTRLVIDKVNEALTAVKNSPEEGELLYQALYLTYVLPEKLAVTEVCYRMNVSRKQYYRIRDKGIKLLAIRLWGAPQKDMEFWMEMLVIFDNKEN